MFDQLDPTQVTHPTRRARPTSSYAIGPLDPSHLFPVDAWCSNGETCPLLIPKALPTWVGMHPEFRDGYDTNFVTEGEGADLEPWDHVPRMITQIYSKLRGKGFEDLSGEVAPDFGPWEIGYLVREFTRLAQTDRVLALTGLAHMSFLFAFLPAEPPACWPPQGFYQSYDAHVEALQTYRARVRSFREQGQRFEEAQRSALVPGPALPDPQPDHLAPVLVALQAPPCEPTTPAGWPASRTFDLGMHVLEVGEDHTVLLADHAAATEIVQLDAEESYRLLVALQSMFAAPVA